MANSSARPWYSRFVPHDWFPKSERKGLAELLTTLELAAFTNALIHRDAAGAGVEAAQVTVIGDQLANIALEAEAHGRRGDARRIIWGVTSKTTGSLTAVVSAALGGTVLAVNQLPPWGRYVLAAVAFLAAALGALQPGDEFAADVRRHLLYTSLHHDIVQYVTVSLPTASLQDATAKLHSYGVQLARIRLVQPTPGSGKGSLTPG